MRKKIKSIVMNIVCILYKIPLIVTSVVSKRIAFGVMMPSFARAIEETSNYYISFKIRPKKADYWILNEKKSPNANEMAIIIQGPLDKADDFTLNTIKIYNKLFPGVTVILSIWEDEEKAYVDRIERETECIVILNTYPAQSGFLGLNYQITNTYNAIIKAEELGKLFVFKTRTDYRFYKRGLLEYLRYLVLTYPCENKWNDEKYRLIFTSGLNADMYKPFFIGDQFNFGYIDDMKNFWGMPLLENNKKASEYFEENRKFHRTWLEDRNHCSYMSRSYAKRIGEEDITLSIKGYWNFIKSHLIIMSPTDVNAYWHKYYRYNESLNTGSYYIDDNSKEYHGYNWDYCLWNDLFSDGLLYSEDYEKIPNTNRY